MTSFCYIGSYLGYTYAGLQNADQCYCGHEYDKYGLVPETECYLPCSGDSSTTCGGQFTNSVYSIGSKLELCNYRF